MPFYSNAPGSVAGAPRNTDMNYPQNPNNNARGAGRNFRQALRGQYGPGGQQNQMGVMPPPGMDPRRADRIRGQVDARFGGGGGVPFTPPDNPMPGGVPFTRPDNPMQGGVPFTRPDNPMPGGVPFTRPDNPTYPLESQPTLAPGTRPGWSPPPDMGGGLGSGSVPDNPVASGGGTPFTSPDNPTYPLQSQPTLAPGTRPGWSPPPDMGGGLAGKPMPKKGGGPPVLRSTAMRNPL